MFRQRPSGASSIWKVLCIAKLIEVKSHAKGSNEFFYMIVVPPQAGKIAAGWDMAYPVTTRPLIITIKESESHQSQKSSESQSITITPITKIIKITVNHSQSQKSQSRQADYFSIFSYIKG